jgi:hypothetical protein
VKKRNGGKKKPRTGCPGLGGVWVELKRRWRGRTWAGRPSHGYQQPVNQEPMKLKMSETVALPSWL